MVIIFSLLQRFTGNSRIIFRTAAAEYSSRMAAASPETQKELLELMKDKTPRDVRLEFRKGKYFMASTSGLSKGML